MGIHIGIEHRTTYRFDRAVEIHPHVMRLRPAPHCRTPILAYSLKIEPSDHFINWQQDPFGNFMARVVFPEPSDVLDVTVDLIADLTVINPFDFFVEESAKSFPFEYAPQLASDLEPYLRVDGPPGPLLEKWLSGVQVPDDGTAIADFLVGINQRLYNDIAYSIRMEPGVQDPEVTLDRAIGSCRDTGWLLVDALRRLGLAARFVSGYLVQLTSDQKSLTGADGPTADFTDLHAWAEVFVPGAGWIGLDPTSGLFAGEGHIPLACTPHPTSAAPITGSTGPATVEFSFSNVVHRVREDPRVTLPYSPEQWTRIDEVGESVERRLIAGDVRLTMGGEPTFVSIDDMEGAEWNTDADGEAKRKLSEQLALRLHDDFAVGGLIQHGQGKWYPGEPLPRWQLDIVWRRDEQPLWGRRDLLALPEAPGEASNEMARQVAEGIAARFGLDADRVIPAYEDPIDLAWREARLPGGDPPAADVDPDAPDELAAPDGRAAIVDRLRSVAGEPTGYVLPIHPATAVADAARAEGSATGDWRTSRWTLRRGRLYLIAGDSPVGLRLPLDSLTWSDLPVDFERSPFETRGDLPAHGTQPKPATTVEVHETAPTALAVEVRNGNVCVFLPPLEQAEDAVELLAVVEAVAIDHDCPLVIEGYPLPRDARLNTLIVTPDPGVIEVNVQPSSSWAELRHVVETLYESARLTRLGTEKFTLDGKHTGTGGGNHVTLGGATPADSPLLRRPDLLQSMVTYWQHHPSMSYLFSGQFIGPTSQAPRVDEASVDTVYELEIAFAELQRLGGRSGHGASGDGASGDGAPPWMVDRLLRHLLVDLTGNTHRSEFCIDKLFSPDSDRGRLGILELRAFEMPPHPQMALVQSLLVRSLVARFWDEPYSGRLVRWGTDLYDRYLLPWYVRADIHDVVADLRAHDIEFDPAWLEPFLEFRFPLVGELELDDVRLEIRGAIEPWHVLGEEVAGSGTARYVDSSIERLQVLVEGFNEARHILTCNGIPVPLQSTSTSGTAVAGVRFKAWAPWSALHPTIDAHGPLVFDLVDRWSAKSIGGCTYEISHPGGRSYDTFPVNAAEAEARRHSRFSTRGHTAGAIDVAELDRMAAGLPREYARTLDLRRFPPRD